MERALRIGYSLSMSVIYGLYSVKKGTSIQSYKDLEDIAALNKVKVLPAAQAERPFFPQSIS